jgi:hypothetical protein
MLGFFTSAVAACATDGRLPAAKATPPASPSVVSKRVELLISSTIFFIEQSSVGFIVSSFSFWVVLLFVSTEKIRITDGMVLINSHKANVPLITAKIKR